MDFALDEAQQAVADLADRAAELAYPALALADRDGLYGMPRFHQAARAAGLRAIVGARVRVGLPGESRGEPGAGELLLLVRRRVI